MPVARRIPSSKGHAVHRQLAPRTALAKFLVQLDG